MPPQRLRSGERVIIRGERWTVTRAVDYAAASLLDVRGTDRANRGETARFLLPAEPVQRLPAATAPRLVRPRAWRRLAAAALCDRHPSPASLRTAAAARFDLLPFQLEPALAVLQGGAARVLVADEVGLGKTVQAGLVIAELLARHHDAHVLVVCPAALRGQWQAELHDRFHIRAPILDSGTLGLFPAGAVNPWLAEPAVITSSDFVKRPEVIRSLEGLLWDLVVLDEAHALAGRSDRAASARVLAARARHVLLLTATPHSGDDQSFERLSRLGDVADGSPILVFRRTRKDADLPASRRTAWLRVRLQQPERDAHDALMAYARAVWQERGTSDAAARLAAIVLVRRACSSMVSLARSIERRLTLLGSPPDETALQIVLPFAAGDDDDEPAAVLGARGMHDAAAERRALERILGLTRAVLGESKLQRLAHLVRRLRGEPAIVFTAYRDTLAVLERVLAGHQPIVLHGGLTSRERAGVIARFNNGGARLLLATDAASEGVNLQRRCRTVVNLELPWTPLRLEQRIGRVDRIGQRGRVHAINLVAAGTAEETSVATLLRRIGHVTGVMGRLRGAGLDEDAVARHAIGREEPVDTPAAPGTPAGLVLASPALRAAACAEASRVAVWRDLHGIARGAALDHRPFVAISRRATAAVWAVRVELADEAGDGLWETIIGARGDGRLAERRPAPAVREAWSRAWPLIETCAADVSAGRVLDEVRPWLELAERRERAIVDALKADHSRLAARLLQPSLFDRRSDRASAAQAAVLQDALAHSAARVEALRRWRRLRTHAAAVAFALFGR